jgi:hypothetical protein
LLRAKNKQILDWLIWFNRPSSQHIV